MEWLDLDSGGRRHHNRGRRQRSSSTSSFGLYSDSNNQHHRSPRRNLHSTSSSPHNARSNSPNNSNKGNGNNQTPYFYNAQHQHLLSTMRRIRFRSTFTELNRRHESREQIFFEKRGLLSKTKSMIQLEFSKQCTVSKGVYDFGFHPQGASKLTTVDNYNRSRSTSPHQQHQQSPMHSPKQPQPRIKINDSLKKSLNMESLTALNLVPIAMSMDDTVQKKLERSNSCPDVSVDASFLEELKQISTTSTNKHTFETTTIRDSGLRNFHSEGNPSQNPLHNHDCNNGLIQNLSRNLNLSHSLNLGQSQSQSHVQTNNTAQTRTLDPFKISRSVSGIMP